MCSIPIPTYLSRNQLTKFDEVVKNRKESYPLLMFLLRSFFPTVYLGFGTFEFCSVEKADCLIVEIVLALS